MFAAIFVILSGLVYTFYEKKHLFSWPPKFVNSLILLLIVGGAIAALVDSCNKQKSDDVKDAKIDSLRIENKTLSNTMVGLREDNKQAQREHTLELTKSYNNTLEILAKYGLKVDTLDNSIKKLKDKVVREIPPTLDIHNLRKHPVKHILGVCRWRYKFAQK